MTTGTVVRDDRASAVVPYTNCFGSTSTVTCLSGKYYRKQWSGSDTPHRVTFGISYEKLSYTVYNKYGNPVGTRTRVLKSRRSPYAAPKNDNPYSMDLDERYDRIGFQDYLQCSPRRPQIPIATQGYPCWAFDRVIWNSNNDYALYGKLSDELGSGFNLSVFLGEGKESLQTITQAATRIYRAAREVKKGRFNNAANILVSGSSHGGRGKQNKPGKVFASAKQDTKDFASLWLQLQYGWMPLLQDVYAAAKHLAYLQNRPFVATYRVRKTALWSGTSYTSNLPTGSDRYTGWLKESHTLVAKITSVNEAALLGLTNPAAVAWELIPYSFVADWFIPVGNYLEAINLRSALTGSFVLTTFKDGRVYDVFNNTIASPYRASFYARKLKVVRTVGSSLPVKLPAVKSLESAASWKHCVNAVALLTQFWK